MRVWITSFIADHYSGTATPRSVLGTPAGVPAHAPTPTLGSVMLGTPACAGAHAPTRTQAATRGMSL